MEASEVMTQSPVSVEPGTTLERALEILQTLEVRHLPVVNRGGELVGMVSDRDLRGPWRSISATPGSLRVADLMSADVLSVHPETEVTEIIDLMIEQRVGAIPVVDSMTGELMGIVSYVDLLRALRPS